MEKLKRLLFEKAYQAEQLRGSYTQVLLKLRPGTPPIEYSQT